MGGVPWPANPPQCFITLFSRPPLLPLQSLSKQQRKARPSRGGPPRLCLSGWPLRDEQHGQLHQGGGQLLRWREPAPRSPCAPALGGLQSARPALEGGLPLQFVPHTACWSSPPLPPAPPPAPPPSPDSPAGLLQVWATTPGLLLALGIVLLAVGAALVATPLAIAHTRRGGGSTASRPQAQAQAQPASLNAEGVPIDAMPADQQQQDELADCRSQLQDRSAYSAAAAAAEASLLGAGAAALPRPELQRAVGGLPPLLFGTVFWVLVSESHPWTPAFQAAAATQVRAVRACPGCSRARCLRA